MVNVVTMDQQHWLRCMLTSLQIGRTTAKLYLVIPIHNFNTLHILFIYLFLGTAYMALCAWPYPWGALKMYVDLFECELCGTCVCPLCSSLHMLAHNNIAAPKWLPCYRKAVMFSWLVNHLPMNHMNHVLLISNNFRWSHTATHSYITDKILIDLTFSLLLSLFYSRECVPGFPE